MGCSKKEDYLHLKNKRKKNNKGTLNLCDFDPKQRRDITKKGYNKEGIPKI